MNRMRTAIVAGLALFATPASAADVLLQTVDLIDQGWSAEGGEVKLFRVTKMTTGNCKIEAVHYGETGRTTYRFIFSQRLNFAAKREYRYPESIATMKKVEMKLVSEILLNSELGKEMLPMDFDTYKAFFDPAMLAACSSRKQG